MQIIFCGNAVNFHVFLWERTSIFVGMQIIFMKIQLKSCGIFVGIFCGNANNFLWEFNLIFLGIQLILGGIFVGMQIILVGLQQNFLGNPVKFLWDFVGMQFTFLGDTNNFMWDSI